jgi:hypothetical protein
VKRAADKTTMESVVASVKLRDETINIQGNFFVAINYFSPSKLQMRLKCDLNINQGRLLRRYLEFTHEYLKRPEMMLVGTFGSIIAGSVFN